MVGLVPESKPRMDYVEIVADLGTYPVTISLTVDPLVTGEHTMTVRFQSRSCIRSYNKDKKNVVSIIELK